MKLHYVVLLDTFESELLKEMKAFFDLVLLHQIDFVIRLRFDAKAKDAVVINLCP